MDKEECSLRYVYDTPIGKLLLEENGEGITQVDFLTDISTGELELEETPLLKEAGKQLKEYFLGTRTAFQLPLCPKGTDFQKAVWKALENIPYGETKSYKDIAEAVGSPKGFRAVGMANNKNPIPIIIPCHRVIGADGKLVGYGGGLPIKVKLLELEKNKNR